MLSYLQRKLIYRPTRQVDIDLERAGLSPQQARAVQVETHDGLLLNGWHVFAASRSGSADVSSIRDAERPMIVYFPGNARNREFRGLNCRILAQAGADVLLVDYRGYAENPGSPCEEHIAADARAVCDFALQTLGVPASNLVLYGESLGGAVATRLAAEMCAAAKSPAALVLGWTFPTLADAAGHRHPWLPVRWALVERYASIAHIANVCSPILMLHGCHDTELPVELGRKLFAAAPPASHSGIEKRFVELPAGHNDVYRVAGNELRTAIERFLGDVLNVRATLAQRPAQNAELV
ncbi:MAG: alpha/beta hydrolase [Planctomycetaceae bacterium]